jgi:hypothetical protein
LLVAADREVVEADQDAEHRDDADDAHDAEARLTPTERAGDFAPLAQRVEHDAHQAADGGVIRVLIPGRTEQTDRHPGKHQQRADPSDDSKDGVKHDYPRQRSLSTDLAVRNKPKVMKLR